MLHLDPLSKNIPSQWKLLLTTAQASWNVGTRWRVDDEIKKKPRITTRNNSLAISIVMKRPKILLFLWQHQKDKGPSQAYFNSYKVSGGRHAKSIHFPVLSTGQFTGRMKGLAKTILPAFIRSQHNSIRLTHLSVIFVYFMAAISLWKRSDLHWQRRASLTNPAQFQTTISISNKLLYIKHNQPNAKTIYYAISYLTVWRLTTHIWVVPHR